MKVYVTPCIRVRYYVSDEVLMLSKDNDWEDAGDWFE